MSDQARPYRISGCEQERGLGWHLAAWDRYRASTEPVWWPHVSDRMQRLNRELSWNGAFVVLPCSSPLVMVFLDMLMCGFAIEEGGAEDYLHWILSCGLDTDKERDSFAHALDVLSRMAGVGPLPRPEMLCMSNSDIERLSMVYGVGEPGNEPAAVSWVFRAANKSAERAVKTLLGSCIAKQMLERCPCRLIPGRVATLQLEISSAVIIEATERAQMNGIADGHMVNNRELIEACWLESCMVWYDWCHQHCGVMLAPADHRRAQQLLRLYRTGGVLLPNPAAMPVSERPAAVYTTDDGRLHRDGGPAVEYADGFAAWALWGERVPRFFAETPAERIDPVLVLRQTERPLRRVLVRKCGYARLRALLGHPPQPGERALVTIEVRSAAGGTMRFMCDNERQDFEPVPAQVPAGDEERWYCRVRRLADTWVPLRNSGLDPDGGPGAHGEASPAPVCDVAILPPPGIGGVFTPFLRMETDA